MRRPHVHQRSGFRRSKPEPAPEVDRIAVAKEIAARLAPLIVSADQLGYEKLGDLLDNAQEEAERIVGVG